MLSLIMSYSGLDLVMHIIAFIFAVLYALTIHEFSHGYVAMKQGDNTALSVGRVTLNPMKHITPLGMIFFLIASFGFAKPVPVNYRNFHRLREGIFRVSVAGVFSNFVSAFIFSGLFFIFSSVTFLSLLFYYLVIINITLMIFNLLPIFPLDGYNALTALFPKSSILAFLKRYGVILLIILLVTNILDIILLSAANAILDVFSIFWQNILGAIL